MAQKSRDHEPIRQSVHVDCPVEDAFYLFTGRLNDWWPSSSPSTGEEKAEHVEMEPWVGGRVFERMKSGDEVEWGSVAAWDAPNHVKLTWHPGAAADDRQTVDVEFRTEAHGTRVTLTHTGWQMAGVATCALRGLKVFVQQQMAVAV